MKYRFILLLVAISFLYNPLNAASVLQDSEMDSSAVLNLLDNSLSPFEDMTEYALADNYDGLLISLKKLKKEHDV